MNGLIKSRWFWASAIVVAVTAAIVLSSPPLAPPSKSPATLPTAESTGVPPAENTAPIPDSAIPPPEPATARAGNAVQPPDSAATRLEVSPPATAPETPRVENPVQLTNSATLPLESIAPLPDDVELAPEEEAASPTESAAAPNKSIPPETENAVPLTIVDATPINSATLELENAAPEEENQDQAEPILDEATTEAMATEPMAMTDVETVPMRPAENTETAITVQPENDIVQTAPPAVTAQETLLPAPLVADTLNSISAPELAYEASGAPATEAVPLLSASSPPLSLAEVLPPGVAPVPGQIAPSFDLVRVAPDGSAVIAGRAAPGANVQVFSGKVPIAEATASARGEFVLFLESPGEQTLDVNIPNTPEGAQLVVSQDDIVILPAQPDMPDAAPVVLRRTPDAVQIVQRSGPAIPANVSLDLVSYAASGAVQLAGRGQPGNTARIYANDVLAGEVNIASGGNWALEIAELAEGRYILRVDEITPDGSVKSRTDSPFQREFPEASMPETFSQGAKIIVQPGNTLWLMATEAYGDGDAYTQIFSANRDAIRDPDLIYPGQIFSIPRTGE